MFDKIKKTLGRRKPLGAIDVPNAVVVPTTVASSPAAVVVDERLLLKSRFNQILSDPETLELHYKEMLASRGTSEFAMSQMGALPETTKRELVRMWLMSQAENPLKEKTENTKGGGAAVVVSAACKKRTYSDTSSSSTHSATSGSATEEDAKRQKTSRPVSMLPEITKVIPNQKPRPKSTCAGTPSQRDSQTRTALERLLHGDVGSTDQIQRPGSSHSTASVSSAVSTSDVGRDWVEKVQHMHYVVTHRDEYDPRMTKDMGFEKLIIQIRLFLRAESIPRLRQFIDTGGLAALSGVVTGILGVEWREQHETRLLLGVLHCVRIILKTREGADRFHRQGQHEVLFPCLVRMQFSWGEERRAFFRFDHRAVITEIFYYWVRNVGCRESSLESRAQMMLGYLRDFEDKEAKHHDWVAAMHKQRRYKNWHKEVKNTTQPWLGTPWMYYHKENVVASRNSNNSSSSEDQDQSSDSNTSEHHTTRNQYNLRSRHPQPPRRPFSEQFGPTRRPELVSSTVRSHTETLVAHYVAANLDLMNLCIVAQRTRAGRNALRGELADCGFEDLFGRKLRLASQVNFPCIDSALRDWVTAAKADGWPVAHVTALKEDEEADRRGLARAGTSGGDGGIAVWIDEDDDDEVGGGVGGAVAMVLSGGLADEVGQTGAKGLGGRAQGLENQMPGARGLLKFDVLEDTPFDF